MNDQFKTDLLENGYAIFDVDSPEFILEMRKEFEKFSEEVLGKKLPEGKLENLHHNLKVDGLNEFRLKSIKLINQNEHFRSNLKSAVLPYFQRIFGPDLAVQKNINLVFTLPGDVTSQIPLHSDGWTGHSIFELNLWIPFTRTHKSQSMFIMPLTKHKKYREAIQNSEKTISELMTEYGSEMDYIEMNPGQALIFWHFLPHGNLVNREEISRLSLNLRVKSLFTPYGDKGLGDYFTPWSYGPMTELIFKSGER